MGKQLNSVGKAIYDTDGNAKLDSSVKRLLAQKPILAFILKYTVKEYAGLTDKEIKQCIDSVQVEEVPVDPGSTNNISTGQLNVRNESSITGESYTLYDVRFFAGVPGKTEIAEYRLIIDVEAQKDPNPGYWPESRGILYCGRMLSEQMGRNVKGDHYENLQKVYSIWIVMNSAQKDANTITEYGIRQTDHVGDFTGNPRIDLMSVLVIRLPKDDDWDKAKNPSTNLTRMLSILLSNKVTKEKKIETLEHDYHIETTEEIRKEIDDMCDYSSMIANNAADETELANIKSLMRKKGWSAEEAMDTLDIPEDKQAVYASILKEATVTV